MFPQFRIACNVKQIHLLTMTKIHKPDQFLRDSVFVTRSLGLWPSSRRSPIRRFSIRIWFIEKHVIKYRTSEI